MKNYLFLLTLTIMIVHQDLTHKVCKKIRICKINQLRLKLTNYQLLLQTYNNNNRHNKSRKFQKIHQNNQQIMIQINNFLFSV